MEHTPPFKRLLGSRKFLIMVMDTVISFALFFGAKYFTANMDDIKFIIIAVQPVALMLIGAIAYEDGQANAGGMTRP